MALSWNEIKERAVHFSKEWENDFNEDAEAKSFMDEFFNVFGVPRRRVAGFEINVKKDGGKQGYIDLLWKGTILIEFKSRGKDLDKAHQQAKDYFPGLKDHELPKYILVSDFARFRLYDLDENTTVEFPLSDFVNNVHYFDFIAGYQKRIFGEQDPANIEAAELMGKLHDRLEEIGYIGHPLEVYLVRILFCLFAEDTTIFYKQQFQEYIEQRTNQDGSDLASKLHELFQVLNTPTEKRFKNLDEQLVEFPYVNGKLFEEVLPTASFDSKMRQALLNCCYIDWSKISPAIFGSMFQSVMNKVERRNIGAHYTSEKNILKLIKPLFLDQLWDEFEQVKSNRNRVLEFHNKIAALKFLDPACGCGNFLVITYRELRRLEIEVIKCILFTHQKIRKEVAAEANLHISQIAKLDVDSFFGIEYEEFPARIAEVAMWLIDHQMNQMISKEFGQYMVRLPLKKAASIFHGNALATEWEKIIPKTELSYILGNPPFIGKSMQSAEQKRDMEIVFKGVNGAGVLDYVAGWYVKAAQYIQGTNIKVGFVSTNSIAQGEQPGVLWGILYASYNIKIHFAHRTFSWNNEAKGNAAVHVVIIGFGNSDIQNKRLFEYEIGSDDPDEIKVKNINPYLVEGGDVLLLKRSTPICNVPPMSFGSMPNDGGNLILSDEEKAELISKAPATKKLIRKFMGSQEYINNESRWTLWLKDVDPNEYRGVAAIIERIKKVKEYRLQSKRAATVKLASTPTLFGEIRQPKSKYLLVPSVSSENRKYIPIGYLQPSVVASNLALTVANAELFHFGVLTSLMHMIWIKSVCGRLESRYRYSAGIVYNNFPWPEQITEKQIKVIGEKAQKVLDTRTEFHSSSLADLYDPLTMPPALVKAHVELDKAVDLAYRSQPFPNEAKRMEFLFELYEKYTADLFTKEKPSITKRKQKN